MSIVIKADKISKYYRLGAIGGTTLQEDFNRYVGQLRGKMRGEKVEDAHLWALRDVSFEIKQGEAVGIIGKNGAGKSTLLKLLSRITVPTQGELRMKGRVASLLEVGTGFHPELTGRENIFLNGAILGMTKSEIKRKLDEIIEFSGVEKFVETPVKRYSSGMRVRLAFAVAAHLDPEIMIIDEVLAVGDAEFQKKCLNKMEDVAGHGRTILFVSHNMSAVNKLCTRGIVLKNGSLSFDGATSEAISHYMANNESPLTEGSSVQFGKDDKPLQLRKVTLHSNSNEEKGIYDYAENINLKLDFDINALGKGYYAMGMVRDSVGSVVYVFADDDLKESVLSSLSVGSYSYRISLPTRLLKPGKYYLTVALNEKGTGPIDKKESVLSFEVEDLHSRRGMLQSYRRLAVVAPEIEWHLER